MNAPHGRGIRRREFLRSAAGLAAGAAAGFGLAPRPAQARSISPNSKVVVAHIGVGGMGNGHVSWFAGLPDVEVAAVCDVDAGQLERTVTRLGQLRPGRPVRGYHDFREVLDRSDIDAITCATPDHWHPLVSIMAFQAGKDVYSEKPLCHSVGESHAMVRAMREHKRVFQLGTQIHEGENYHRAVELVRSGILGPIHTVRVWKEGGSPGLGFPKETAPPPNLDWNMWLGPAPLRPYIPVIHPFNFRYFWDYSGGNYADFWCHIADIAFWALGLGEPRTISARGETPTDGVADTPAWIDVDYDFGEVKLLWTTHAPDVPGAAGRGIGARFEGTRGSLVVDYGSRVLFIDGKQTEDVPEVPRSIPRSPGHQRAFVDSVRSRVQPESHLVYAQRMTLPMLLGCISFRLRRPLQWDAAAQRFVGDETANRMLNPPYRAPWLLPV